MIRIGGKPIEMNKEFNPEEVIEVSNNKGRVTHLIIPRKLCYCFGHDDESNNILYIDDSISMAEAYRVDKAARMWHELLRCYHPAITHTPRTRKLNQTIYGATVMKIYGRGEYWEFR